ncbi:MAG: hypothetical protein E7135_01980 [Rikenellaceae bacterium]|nr:hypothetical protein [Rikenellaceae bacterium]
MKTRFLALAALVLGLASCQTEPEGLDVNVGGEEVNTVLTVTIPETETRTGGANSAIGAFGNVDFSQYDVRFILEVYNMEGQLINELAKERLVNTEDDAKSTAFDLRLIPGRDYRFVVWADIVAQGSEADLHYDTTNLKEVKIATTEWNLTDETRDAYTNIYDVEDFSTASNISIELKRPLGKLRVVTTDIKDMFNVLPEDIKVVYSTDIYTSFNAFTSDVIAAETVTHEKTIKISENKYANEWDATTGKSKGTMTLFTDYYFAAKDQEPINFTLDVKDNNGDAIPQVQFNTPIPVQRNYLTTVMGPILTDAANINVYINDAFEGYHEIDADIKDQLEEATKYKNYVIDLKGDLIWETGGAHGSTPLIPEGAETETLTINGNGYKVIATGAGVGPIRMANGGKLIFNDVTIVDQTESYAENSWEFGYLEFAGELEFNDCVIDNTIAIDGEEAVFNNCTFNDKVYKGTEGQEYAAWVSNGKAHFNNCSFSGARGIKVHEDYGSEVAEVVVDKCQFNNLSKKPGMAIGTVNAATKIEIKNSTFTNCQPGDQGLFMYETDTNVATFDFSQTNNTVNAVVASSEVLAKVMKADFHTLNISLNADVAVDVNANMADYYFGGNNTNVITIDGAKVVTAAATGAGNNAYTLTFNHKNSDWNYVRLANADAKLVIRNAKITNTGNNNGPWNRHDISFFNDVELENVTSDKAIALFGDSDLTNVIISDVHPNNSEAYALWIRPFGQTVNIKDCALLAHESKTTDRGIKIDNQYVNEDEAKVTLNIDGLKVKSQKKAAIVVKSTKGADINIKNIDITEVAADNANAVWVDESTKQYAGLVTVAGASMVVEGVAPIEGETTEDVQAALNTAVTTENAVVQLPAGEYTFPNNFAKGVTVICEEGTVFNGKSSLNINGATVMGATFQSGSDDLVAYYSTINGTYKNCVFNGDLKFSNAGDTVVFENCVFNGPDYALHFDSAVAGSHVILKGCEVNSEWRVAIGAAVSMFEAIDTKFTVAGFINLWGKAKFTNCAFNKPYYWICSMDYTEYTNCTCEGRALVADDILIEDTVIKINDEFYASNNESLKIALEKNASVVNLLAGNYELSGLNFVANNVTLKGVDKANVVLNLEQSIYLQNKSVTLENLTYNLNAGKGYTEQAFAFVHHATAFNLKNCNVNRLRLNVYEANIEDCTFTLNTSSGFDGYCIYYYGNDNSTVNVKNSTFATAGKGICIYSESAKAYNLNVDKCSFTSSDSATDKAAIQMHTELGISGNVKITETTATGFANINGGLWNELNNNTKVATDKFDIWVDGTQVH